MRTFQIPAQITGVSTKSDRSLSIRVVTEKEMGPEETAHLMQYVRRTGWMLFRANEFSDSDTPISDAPRGHNTPAQELRSKLFRLFKQEHPDKPEREFNPFYEQWMSRITEKIKDKLD